MQYSSPPEPFAGRETGPNGDADPARRHRPDPRTSTATTPIFSPRWAGASATRASGAAWRARCSRKAPGVSERYLAQLEAGEGNASVLLLRNVARALDLPLTELIDGSEHPGRAAADPPVPRAPAGASAGRRRLPADARLRPRGIDAQEAHRARRPARRGQDDAGQRPRGRTGGAVRRARPRDRARGRDQPLRSVPALRAGGLPAHRAALPRAR